jgi:hypothetical protein
MKLSQLFEAPADPRDLLRDVAKELGLSNPHFYDIDDDTTNAAEVRVGIDLYRLHQDTEGSADISGRLKAIHQLANQAKFPDNSGPEALEYFDGQDLGKLPHVAAFHQALVTLSKVADKVRESVDTCFKAYFLLGAINTAAITTVSSKYDADELKYRSSIARACLKQLGITPKDL